MSILIKDNQTGNIREYGTNGHDALHISPDGSCLRYENMQNGDGSLGGGYSFVMEDGKIPKESETADAIHAMCYFNIGGFRTEPKEHGKGEWIEGENGNIKCNKCGCEIRFSYLIGNKPDFPKFCCDCGTKMKGGAE